MVDDFDWFMLDNLPLPMHSQFDPFTKKYGDRLKEILNSQTA